MDQDQLQQFFAAMMARDRDTLEASLSEDVVLEFPGSRFGGRFQGRRKVVIFLLQNQRLFQDGLAFTIHWSGICGDRAVVQWTNQGTTVEGQEYANRGCTVIHLEGGLITEIQDYLDTELIAATWPG
jgi:ketosteroid isomerase-like protein